ncbi:thiolase family protein [Balneolaceae bacterium ANBcel3]|nr:thiolase family protein [Balneolaceae bacterium ANBcel3]
MNPVYIVDAVRTPACLAGGALSTIRAPELGSIAIAALYKRNSITPDKIDHVWMGNAFPAGSGSSPARQAALLAGLPYHTPGTLVHSGCCSGMQAIITAADTIKAGTVKIAAAGGMESMSQIPHYLPGIRLKKQKGNLLLHDGMECDGQTHPFSKKHYGILAEKETKTHDISREEQEHYALQSFNKLKQASEQQAFKNEILPVTIRSGTKHAVVKVDEGYSLYPAETVKNQVPAYDADGSITSATSAMPGDASSALLLMEKDSLTRSGKDPIARIVSYASVANNPKQSFSTQAAALSKLYSLSGYTPEDIDVFEIHESYAASVLFTIRTSGLDPAKVNLHGGALCMGHPAGASGARQIVSLCYILKKYGLKRGCAVISNPLGESCAVMIESA